MTAADRTAAVKALYQAIDQVQRGMPVLDNLVQSDVAVALDALTPEGRAALARYLAPHPPDTAAVREALLSLADEIENEARDWDSGTLESWAVRLRALAAAPPPEPGIKWHNDGDECIGADCLNPAHFEDPARSGSIDAAWAAVEAALPEGWRPITVGPPDPDAYDVAANAVTEPWQATTCQSAFFNGETEDDNQWAGGYGPTPAAALQALAARLTEAERG